MSFVHTSEGRAAGGRPACPRSASRAGSIRRREGADPTSGIRVAELLAPEPQARPELIDPASRLALVREVSAVRIWLRARHVLGALRRARRASPRRRLGARSTTDLSQIYPTKGLGRPNVLISKGNFGVADGIQNGDLSC